MVLFCAPAMATAAANAATTGAGLGIAQTANTEQNNIFVKQMAQSKRYFTAGWSQASSQNSENLAQSAFQFSQSQSLALAGYYQSEKQNAQSMKLAFLQDCKNWEMTWRATVRESLRDELFNQFNQYNTLILVDTIALGFVFSNVNPGGAIPIEFIKANSVAARAHVFIMALSLMMFTVSLWIGVIILRRLNNNTASSLELQIFANEDVQQAWQKEIEMGLPSGERLMYLVHQTYNRWFEKYITPFGNMATLLMTLGILLMFPTAGIEIEAVYGSAFKETRGVGLPFYLEPYWFVTYFTIFILLFLKLREDFLARKKQNAYQKTWADFPMNQGIYGKTNRIEEEIFSEKDLQSYSAERCEKYRKKEVSERQLLASSKVVRDRAEKLCKQAGLRQKIRHDVQNILTTATEEVDILSDDLMADLNKVFHGILEIDKETTDLVAAPIPHLHRTRQLCDDDNHSMNSDDSSCENEQNGYSISDVGVVMMNPRAVDAAETPVSFDALRRKLGDSALSAIIRIRNRSDVPLYLKSGLQLQSGRYAKELILTERVEDGVGTTTSKSMACYHLFPISLIPPRTEVVITAINQGITNFIPTSGVQGHLVYTTDDESLSFNVSFANNFIGGLNTNCEVESSNTCTSLEKNEWQISKQIINQTRNSEILIFIENQLGRHRTSSSTAEHRWSNIKPPKKGGSKYFRPSSIMQGDYDRPSDMNSFKKGGSKYFRPSSILQGKNYDSRPSNNYRPSTMMAPLEEVSETNLSTSTNWCDHQSQNNNHPNTNNNNNTNNDDGTIPVESTTNTTTNTVSSSSCGTESLVSMEIDSSQV